MAAGGASRQQVLDLARKVEAAGFDSLWVGDHVAFHVPFLDSLSLLAFIAAATERIRLGTCVYLLPLRHPTITAKLTTTVDVLSDGRFSLGIGVGGEFPPEFDAVGVPVSERGGRADESIELLRRLWSGEAVEHRGRYFTLGPVTLAPRPVQPDGPPILVGGRKPPALRRAGRLGDGYISHMASPEMYRDNLVAIQQHAAEAGRGNRDFETWTFIFTLLDDNYDAALDRAAGFLENLYRVPFRDAARKYCLLGRPEDCLEQMQRFVDAGSRGFIFSPLQDPAVCAEQLAASVLPEMAKLAIP
jgi:probable F420-dependent oxidoreductase